MHATANGARDTAGTTGLLMLIVAGAATLVGALLAWIITRSITRALGGEPNYASSIASEISHGNLAVEVQVADGNPRQPAGQSAHHARQPGQSGSHGALGLRIGGQLPVAKLPRATKT